MSDTKRKRDSTGAAEPVSKKKKKQKVMGTQQKQQNTVTHRKTFTAKHVLSSPFAPVFPAPSSESSSAPSLLRAFLSGTSARKCRALTLGINSVTRALERKQNGQIVVVARDVKPQLLISHLPALCYTRGVPLVAVPGDGSDIAQALGISRCAALAVVTTDIDTEDKDRKREKYKVVEQLIKLQCTLSYPWLKTDAQIETQERDKEEKQTARIKKKKKHIKVEEEKDSVNVADLPQLKFPVPKLIAHRRAADRQTTAFPEEAED